MKTNKIYGMMILIVGVMMVFSLIGCDKGNEPTGGGNPTVPGAESTRTATPTASGSNNSGGILTITGTVPPLSGMTGPSPSAYAITHNPSNYYDWDRESVGTGNYENNTIKWDSYNPPSAGTFTILIITNLVVYKATGVTLTGGGGGSVDWSAFSVIETW